MQISVQNVQRPILKVILRPILLKQCLERMLWLNVLQFCSINIYMEQFISMYISMAIKGYPKAVLKAEERLHCHCFAHVKSYASFLFLRNKMFKFSLCYFIFPSVNQRSSFALRSDV